MDYTLGLHKYYGPSSLPRDEGLFVGLLPDLLLLLLLLLHREMLHRRATPAWLATHPQHMLDRLSMPRPFTMRPPLTMPHTHSMLRRLPCSHQHPLTPLQARRRASGSGHSRPRAP